MPITLIFATPFLAVLLYRIMYGWTLIVYLKPEDSHTVSLATAVMATALGYAGAVVWMVVIGGRR